MRSPEKTNQMGGAWPTLACSHLASLLQMVPLKPSLPTSSARWFASLHAQYDSQLRQLWAGWAGSLRPKNVHPSAWAQHAALTTASQTLASVPSKGKCRIIHNGGAEAQVGVYQRTS